MVKNGLLWWMFKFYQCNIWDVAFLSIVYFFIFLPSNIAIDVTMKNDNNPNTIFILSVYSWQTFSFHFSKYFLCYGIYLEIDLLFLFKF